MRGAAPYFATRYGQALREPFDAMLVSSFCPLAELRGLVPSLARVPAVLYFHENQLAYPTRGDAVAAARDQHFGFTQLVSALSAQLCAFNSTWNLASFLDGGRALLERMPDAVAPGWVDRIAGRSVVIGFPVLLPAVADATLQDVPPGTEGRAGGPLILWNHRWEHDKDPETFFRALLALKERSVPFRLAVCGERFRRVPAIFAEAREQLRERVVHWGYAPSRRSYEALLCRSQLAVSTARHEFFGVAMLEATWFGARPLVPNALAYPELYPRSLRHDGPGDLVRQLEHLCRGWTAGRFALRADRRALCRQHQQAPFLARLRDVLLGPSGACARQDPSHAP